MEDFLIYLLKSAGLLGIFFLFYFFLLRKDTSFQLNRMFLIIGIITSLLLPSAEFTRIVIVENTATAFPVQEFSGEILRHPQIQQEKGINWWQIAGIVYLVGLGIFLFKFLFQLFSLQRFFKTGVKTEEGKFTVIATKENVQPFSFFKYIILNPSFHTQEELDMILKHEKAHAEQRHSIDVLLSTLSTYFLWFSPFSWLYRKYIIQNLEYLADKEVVTATYSRKAYQKTLLKFSVADLQPALVNQFYQSFIKKRIVMLNKNSSQKPNFWKVFLLLPFLLLFMFSFNVRSEEQIDESPSQMIQDTHKNDESLFVTITKTTSKETMNLLVGEFEKRDVVLTFEKLEFSPEGFITKVAVSIRTTDFEQSQIWDITNAEGIKDFVIYAKENGTIGFGEANQSELGEMNSGLHNIGLNALIIVNGKIFERRELAGKSVLFDGDIQRLAPDQAILKYGEKAVEGALVITNGDIIDIRDTEEMYKEKTPTGYVTRNYLSIEEKSHKRTVVTFDQNVGIGITGNGKSGKNNKVQEVPSQPDPESGIIEEGSLLDRIGNKPLYIIGDQEYSTSELAGKYVRVQGSISSLSPKEGQKLYGKEAKDGVLIIPQGIIGKNFQREMKRIGKEKIAMAARYLQIWENKPPSLFQTFKVENMKFGSPQVDVNPDEVNARQDIHLSGALIIVDGKEMDEGFDINSLDPTTIKSMVVLKGSEAVKKYGERASHGAIEIELKAEGENNADSNKDIGYGNSTETDSIKVIGYAQNDKLPKSDVLYVVDGKVMDKDFDPGILAPRNIKSINILKGARAIEQYGEKGNLGVIEITTKE